MVTRVRRRAATQPWHLTELRLLVELSALRKLTDRGLCEQELAVARKLADATMRPARAGDVRDYLQADTVFHLRLLELAGSQALSEVARALLASIPVPAPRAESGHLMTAEAREHRELVNMLVDDRVSAADDLLRRHISRQWAGWPAPASVLAGPEPTPGEEA